MADIGKQTKKRRWVRRLFAMQPYEIAWVDFGANHRPFAVVKEDSNMKRQGLPLSDLERAHAMLGELIPIYKAEAGMTPEAAKLVAEKLDAVADLIMPDLDPPGGQATITLKETSTDLRKKLEALSHTALATDYTFGDQVDAVLEVAKQLEAALAEAPATIEAPVAAAPEVPVEPAVPPAADPPVPGEPVAAAPAAPAEAPATIAEPPALAALAAGGETPAPIEPKAAEAPAAPAVPAIEPIAPVAPAATAATPAAEAPTAVAPAPATAAAPAGPPMSSMIDMEAVKSLMKAALDEALKDVRADVAKVVETQKALTARTAGMPAMPATHPGLAVRPLPKAQPVASDPLESMDLTQSADLLKIDDYGRIIS